MLYIIDNEEHPLKEVMSHKEHIHSDTLATTSDYTSKMHNDIIEERHFEKLTKTERNYRICDKSRATIGESDQILYESRTDWNVKVEPDIMVKAHGDKFPSDITGSCFVPYDNLVVTDYSNKSVKLLNTKQCNLKSILKLKSEPWAVAYNSDDGRIAVSVPKEGQIYILCIRLSGELAIVRTIGVEKQCRGIIYHNGCLMISYGHYKLDVAGKIQVVDSNGVVLRTIDRDTSGKPMFEYPSHLALNQAQSKLYVTDFKTAKVTAFNIDLLSNLTEQNAVQNDLNRLQDPRGIVVDTSGNIFVCDYTTGSVYIFNDKLEQIKVLVGSDHGIVNPRSIAYDTKQDKLYVGMFYNRFVRVFEIQHSKWNYENDAFIA